MKNIQKDIQNDLFLLLNIFYSIEFYLNIVEIINW